MVVPAIARQILKTERSHTRFEKFCADLFSDIEGTPFVTTSASWDRGRDARNIRPSTGSHDSIVCCTLDEGLDSKSEADIKRLVATSSPRRVVYCTSQEASDHQLDNIEAGLRRLLPAGTSLTMVGGIQLGDLAETHAKLFERHYAAEIRNLALMFESDAKGADEGTTRGLRLALLAFGEDGMALRRSLSQRAVLEVLAAANTATVDAIAKRFSDSLHLPRIVRGTYVKSALHELEQTNLVAHAEGDLWMISDAGRAALAAVPAEAAAHLLEGRARFEQRILELTGYQFGPDEFGRIWTTFLDFLSELFYSNGLAIVESVAELLGQDGSDGERSASLRELLRAGAAKVRAATSGLEVGEALEQAVLDVFAEREGPVFEWLSGIAERFVALCSMGFESSSGAEIRKAVLRQDVVLDSDVLLSYLCEGEPEHRAVREVIARWRQLGGRVLVLTPVLEEVATHAWISERDFEEAQLVLRRTSPHEAQSYATNAFVRAFFGMIKRAQDSKKWSTYISQFRGSSREDYGNILHIAEQDLGAERLPDAFDKNLRRKMAYVLKWSIANLRGVSVASLDRPDLDKAERDGQLLATLAYARAAHRASDGRSVVLLSSSTRLRRADDKFRGDLGTPPAVLSRAAFAYLLTCIPEAAFGPGSFRKVLFDFGENVRLTDSQRIALRIIKATGEFNLPWSRRRTLERQLDEQLNTLARKLGVNVEDVREQFEKGDESVRPAEIIAEALSAMAVSDKTTERLRSVQNELTTKEKEIEALREQIRVLRATREERQRAERTTTKRATDA